MHMLFGEKEHAENIYTIVLLVTNEISLKRALELYSDLKTLFTFSSYSAPKMIYVQHHGSFKPK